MAKPKIRFNGYTEDWEQRKLGEVIEGVSKKNANGLYTQDDILACSLGTELDRKTIFYGLRSTEDSVKSYRIVNIGNVIYTKSPIKGYPNGIVRTCKIVDGIVPSLYCVYKKKENISIPIDTRFIQSYLEDKGRLDQYLCPLVNVGARNNVNITDKEFLEGIIKIPTTVEEQAKIVDVLEKINHLITLHQRKCEQTKTLKKYMLQKMFPQDGEKVPQIRFEGFTEDWEQRELSEIALQTYGGGTPKTANEEFWKGNIPWIQSSDLIEERLFNVKPRKYISQEAISKSSTKLVPQNSIAIVTRVGVGKLAFMPFSYATSQDFLSLSELKIEPKFAVYALYKMMRLVSNEVQGTSIKGITKDELLAKEILIPDCEEQKKIGAYLHNLDHLITLHQRKCDELKEVKKFMLQNMFV